MNKTILMGRLVRDPDVRYSTNQNGEQSCIARYTLAVDRRKKDEADFISCVAFGKGGEFAEKYLKKGTKICISGRIQTGSYTNKDGQKVYTTDVVVEETEFAESRNSGSGSSAQTSQPAAAPPAPADEQWIPVPDGIEDDLPFK